MRLQPITVIGVLAALVSCDRFPFLGGPASAGDVAQSFWEATQAGDIELANTYTTGSGNTTLQRPDGGDLGITDLEVGGTTRNGDQATVETRFTASPGENSVPLAFNTHLTRVDGQWRVDLDKTTDEMMLGLVGVSMTDVASAMGEAMSGAMRGAAADSSAASGETPGATPEAQQPAAQPRPTRAQTPTQTAQASDFGPEVPWTPTQSGTVSPGMNRDQVVEAWGTPVVERVMGNWTYLFYRNGCERRCGTFDLVLLEGNQVVDAVVRTPVHTYTGVSSSPPGTPGAFTPPQRFSSPTGAGG